MSRLSSAPHAALFRIMAGLLLGAAAFAPAGHAQEGGLCETFEQVGSTSGFAACPDRPQVTVSTDTANGIDGSYLLLQDLSGPSQACNVSPRFTGNWLEKVGQCGRLCFDFRLFYAGQNPDGSTPTVYPRIVIVGPAPTNVNRAVFRAFNPVTMADGWVRICAPIRPLQPGETTLPANADGEWRMPDSSGSNFANTNIANWNATIGNVTEFRLPIDYSPQPSERAGYDNFCFEPGGCGADTPPPSCLAVTPAEVSCVAGQPVVALTLTPAPGTSPDAVEITATTPGVSVVPAGPQAFGSPVVAQILGAAPGSTVSLMVNTIENGAGAVAGSDLCCLGETQLQIPADCTPANGGPVGDGGSAGNAGGAGQGQGVDLALEKTQVPTPAQVGWVAWYLDVTSNGPGTVPAAAGLSVQDQVPAGVTITSAGSADFTCSPVPVTGPATLTCSYSGIGPIPPGPVGRITIEATWDTQETPAPGENCATLAMTAPDAPTDADPQNDSACAPTHTGNARQSGQPEPEAPPALTLAKHGPRRCAAGENCNYTISLTPRPGREAPPLVLFEDEARGTSGARLVVGGRKRGVRCFSRGKARRLCLLEGAAVTRPIRIPATVALPRSARGTVRQCVRGVDPVTLEGAMLVRLVQIRLRQLGLYKGPIDGAAGRGTRAAIAARLREAGLDMPPRMALRDRAFLRSLFGPPALSGTPRCARTRIVPPRSTAPGPNRPPKDEAGGSDKPATCLPPFVPDERGGCRPMILIGPSAPKDVH